MIRLNTLLILIFVHFFFACAGRDAINKKPEHFLSGMKEIKKGSIWYNKGCYKRSLEHFFKAHERFAESDQLKGVAMSLNNIGNIYRIAGDISTALLFFDESFSIYTDIKAYKESVKVLSNKAAALIDGGMLEEAEKVLNMAENIDWKDKKPLGSILNNQGILLIKKKKFIDAEVVLKKSIAISEAENFSEFATANFVLGNLMLETKKYKQAVNFFESALEADRKTGFHKGIADDLAALGSTYLNLGKTEYAVNFFKRSIKIYALLGERKKVHKIMEQLEKESKKTGIDISVTTYFVKRWLEGKILEDPCQ